MNSKSNDEDGKSTLFKNRVTYQSPAVRIENWNEDLFLLEERMKLTNYKRERCQLLVQKTRSMIGNLLRPIQLAKETPFVLYGNIYQLKASELPNSLVPEEGPQATHGLYLSGLINERDIDEGTHFMHGCGITASPDKMPCVRNTFVIEDCSSDRKGQTVYYGDDIYIRIYDYGKGLPLYVQCECPIIDNFGGHLLVRLTQSPDIYCRFKAFHWDPHLRFETTGSSFAPDSRIIIRHTASGRNLAAEYRNWIPTFFGAEVVVTCHTCKDSHNMESAENMWKIMSEKNPDINLYVRAAKGEEIPADMLN